MTGAGVLRESLSAKRHSRAELDIKPELYDLWLDQLVQAVREFDRMFDTEIEAAWRRLLQAGIECVKSSGYQRAGATCLRRQT